MIRILLTALAGLATLVPFYLVAVYTNWAWHPAEWSPEGRFFSAAFALAFAWGAAHSAYQALEPKKS